MSVFYLLIPVINEVFDVKKNDSDLKKIINKKYINILLSYGDINE